MNEWREIIETENGFINRAEQWISGGTDFITKPTDGD